MRALIEHLLSMVTTDQSVLTPSQGVADALTDAGIAVTVTELAHADSATADFVLLAEDELSHAEHHAEWLIDRAANLLTGGLLLTATLPDGHKGPGRVFTPTQLTTALNQRGFVVTHGPALEDDRYLTVARAPVDQAERSRVFFATLPRKMVAASTVCTSSNGRLLIVYDRFRGHWTTPGGLVDPDEAPPVAARRETWEEAGVHAEVGELAGVFHYTEPDRLILLYHATVEGEPPPDPVHVHEIAEARWVTAEEALTTVNPLKAGELEHALGLT